MAERFGMATNNVAEYRAVIKVIERAQALGAGEVELIGDSELVARQLTGAYKVKHPAMKPLYLEALAALPASTAGGYGRAARAERPRRRARQRRARRRAPESPDAAARL